MSMAQRLSNHFTACRLISLAKHRVASEIMPRDAHGPYVVMQHGYAPGDTTMRSADYILGRSGAWLGTHWFVRMPVTERRKEFVFGTMAEVMEMMEALTSEVQVILNKPDNVDEDGPEDEEMKKALGGH